MKVVINVCHGGFELSKKVLKEMGFNDYYSDYGKYRKEFSKDKYAYRADNKLISAIEKIGIEKSNEKFSELKIIEIPDDVDWTIEEYDGREWVAEKHRTWK